MVSGTYNRLPSSSSEAFQTSGPIDGTFPMWSLNKVAFCANLCNECDCCLSPGIAVATVLVGAYAIVVVVGVTECT